MGPLESSEDEHSVTTLLATSSNPNAPAFVDKHDRCAAHYRMFSNIPYDTFYMGRSVTLLAGKRMQSRVHLILRPVKTKKWIGED